MRHFNNLGKLIYFKYKYLNINMDDPNLTFLEIEKGI